ncbi:RagB/SusD family nutrient uptake outer membrane protein [Mucilaginibacter sp. PPCGB 2223]|uniref:RagB/SusD family nutrient uptake outer membrane protein n=1 Tax=Mucilaginibacter sp. PPCGB 2223 TaxID=1886027 RepID=UPI000A5352AE|nr:RagB/SusD family nutrient uptake outer membrane protein [Mucilaginibacter sp. PPCGB 2223]
MIFWIFCLAVLAACRKDLLDTKPNKALLVPTTLSDMQALLDNIAVFNLTPGITGIADGDFYTSAAGWTAWNTDGERNSYTWAADIYGASKSTDWNIPFQQVFYANVVLEALPVITVTATNQNDFNTIKGTALFSRAFANYHLLQLFAPPYHAASAGTDPGIPLRLASDISQKSVRASVADGYAQVLSDLRAACPLLPPSNNEKSRPVVAAAYALLARTYLVMGDYARAGLYADSCLQSKNTLIDYNTLSTSAAKPFPRAIPYGNDEIIYYSSLNSYSFASSASTLADTSLYRSYAANDLRKPVFFKTSGISGTFKGNYAGIVAVFSGLATDEMYLVRAECAARQGQTAAAMADLNTLLAKRWKTGTFVPFTAFDADAALGMILTERRKELIGRNLRWTDLRRLNTEPRFAVTLTRPLNGNTYTLTPGSKRYTYPLPPDEISLGGLSQNER